MPLIDVPTVHAVTDDLTLAKPGFQALASSFIRAMGPQVAVHLRARTVPTATLLGLAASLAEVAGETGAWLVINDRVDIALATGARAVQLGARSLRVADARGIAGTLAVGASVHSAAEARVHANAASAADARPDWLVAGNVFPTESHPGREGAGLAWVSEVAATGLPVIAIGGVRPEHVPALREAGAFGVATIRGIWNAADPARAAALYL